MNAHEKLQNHQEVKGIAAEVARALLSESRSEFDSMAYLVNNGMVFENIEGHKEILTALINQLDANLERRSFKVWSSSGK